MPLSPDCRNRPFKCPACSGDAWDDDADEMTPCTCPCHEPVPRDLPCSHPVRSSQSGLCLVCSAPLPPERRIDT